MLEIKRYSGEYEEQWNEFVARSKNGTFLFDRRYMDYHANRFTDLSLMVFNEKQHLIALLPANRNEDKVYSHQGLTYGGLVMDKKMTATLCIECFKEIKQYLQNEGVSQVIYKPTPWIYHQMPAEEDLYALIKECGARLFSRDIASVITLAEQMKWRTLRQRGIAKAAKNGLKARLSRSEDDFKAYWKLLDDNLMTTYGAHPVHTIDEILLLHRRFPEKIKLFTIWLNETIMGGILIYYAEPVAHTQYISASPEGKRLGALDLLVRYILDTEFSWRNEFLYFDFGKSTEENGKVLNESLIFQKEGFGARGICYDAYIFDI